MTLYPGETTGFDSVIEYGSNDALSLRKALTHRSVDHQNSQIKETATKPPDYRAMTDSKKKTAHYETFYNVHCCLKPGSKE